MHYEENAIQDMHTDELRRRASAEAFENSVKDANLTELRAQVSNLLQQVDALKAELNVWPERAAEHARNARQDERLNGRLIVGAYLPAEENHPVLTVCVNRNPDRQTNNYYLSVGVVFRRGDIGYNELLNVCDKQPHWLFQQSPQPLE